MMRHTAGSRARSSSPRHAALQPDDTGTQQEREALQKVAGSRSLGRDDVAMLISASSKPAWTSHLVETYLENHLHDDKASCERRLIFADSMYHFGVAAQPAAQRCIDDIRQVIRHDFTTDDANETDDVRWAAARMVSECGSSLQVADIIPDIIQIVSKPGVRNAGELAGILGGHLERFTGADRRLLVDSVRRETPEIDGPALTSRQFVAGRLLQHLGDDHPAAQAWVRAHITGAEPLRNDPRPIEETGRVGRLLGWCEAQIDHGRIDLLRDPRILPTLMTISGGGSLPVCEGASSSPSDMPESERAARLIGLIARSS